MLRKHRQNRRQKDLSDYLKHSLIEEVTEQSCSEPFKLTRVLSSVQDPFEPSSNRLTESSEFFAHMFQPLASGNVKSIILIWVRLAMGVGVLTLPYYVSLFGLVWGCLAVVLAGLLTLDSYLAIVEAAEMAEKDDYPSLVHFLLGKVTFLLDLGSSLTILIVFSWNLFSHAAVVFGLAGPDWGVDPLTGAVSEGSPPVVLARGLFLLGLLLVALPFLAKPRQGLNAVNVAFLAVLLVALAAVLVQAPFFRRAYAGEDIGFRLFEGPGPGWVESFFSILLAFYIQPFVFSLRGQLRGPTGRSIRRIGLATIVAEIVCFAGIGAAGYASLGRKYMPEVFVLRNNYPATPPAADLAYKAVLLLLLVLNSLGMLAFGQIIREYLFKCILTVRSRAAHTAASLLPFLLFFLAAFLKPSIVQWFNLTGLTLCNFNGHIVPLLMRIRIFHMDSRSYCSLLLTYFRLIAMALLGLAGIYYKFRFG